MNAAIDMLKRSRQVRRDLAMAAVSDEEARFKGMLARCEQARADVQQGLQWHRQLAEQSLSRGSRSLLASALPACEALLGRRRDDFSRAQVELRQADERLVVRRGELARLERALLRLQEWKTLDQREALRRRSMLDETEADDQVQARACGRPRP